jgi:folate-binding protein YgfZ
VTLTQMHLQAGAALAPDGIPLHYGDQKAEYHAALEAAVLMDRSHEGRLELSGRDALELLQRMSTNDVLSLGANEGRPTIFTSPIGRIIDRVTVYHRDRTALLLTEPGRGDAVRQYLQRNIFFNDDVHIADLSASTKRFALHGPRAAAVLDAVSSGSSALPSRFSQTLVISGTSVFAARLKPLMSEIWVLLAPNEAADDVWTALVEAGQGFSLRQAGSLTYNALRIRAGRPGVGRELSGDYIPLEVGLWDEVNFHKGCYTGQEIIARMESRSRLAKTLVTLELSGVVEAPAPLSLDRHDVGTLTSSVQTPDGESVGIGVVKVAHAQPGVMLTVGVHQATISGLPGAQPPMRAEQSAS